MSSPRPEGTDAKRPHIISLFNPSDYSTATMPCDLINLTLGQIKAHAALQFGLAGTVFELMHNGNLLGDSGKAIDVGIGNGAVVVAHVKQPPVMPMLPAVNPQLQMYQLALTNQFAASLTSPLPSPQLPVSSAMLAAGPPPPFIPQMEIGARSGSCGSEVSLTTPATSPPSPTPTPFPVNSVPVSTEFCTYAVTSDGSRALLQALQGLPDPAETIDQVLPILCPKMTSLAVNHHASRVIIGIINLCRPQQMLMLLTHICSNVAELVESNSGSEVMVALVNNTKGADAYRNEAGTPLLVEAIAGSLPAFATSVNGRKVLQAVLQKLAPEDVMLIYEAAAVGLVSLATDQCGCITMQRLWDNAGPTVRARLQSQLIHNLEQMLTDPYGNYVVQHAVKGNPTFSAVVAEKVTGRILEFAVNKFASNVIEKCMQTGPDEVREALMNKVTEEGVLEHLIVDAYGNYVVQSVVDQVPVGLLEYLRACILPLVGGSPYGYRIETKLQKRFRSTSRKPPHNGSRQPLQNLSSHAPSSASANTSTTPFAKAVPCSAHPGLSFSNKA